VRLVQFGSRFACFLMAGIAPLLGHADSLDVDVNQTIESRATKQLDAARLELESTDSELHYTSSVAPDVTYKFSFQYRGLSAAGLGLAIFDETHGQWIEDRYLYAAAPVWTWTEISYAFTVPSGCFSIRLYPIRGLTRIGLIDIKGFQLTYVGISDAPTYFVDTVHGRDSFDGRSPERPWKTVRRVSAAQLSPGDVVAFHRNQMWREELNLNLNGTREAPIKLTSYGLGKKPVISGGNLVFGWTPSSLLPANTDVWATQLPHQPSFVKFNGSALPKATSLGDLGATRPWYWTKQKLYVYSIGDPARKFTNPGIEVTARKECIYLYSSSNVEIGTIHLDMADAYGLYIDGGSSQVAVVNTEIGFSGQFGILGSASTMTSDVTVANSVVHHAGAVGLFAGPNSAGWLVKDSELYSNGYVDGTGELKWGANVKVGGFGTTCGPHTLLNLLLYRAGYVDEGTRVTSQDRKGFGIWFDTVDTGTSTVNNVISIDNADSGIFIEKSNQIRVFNALSAGNGEYGLRVDADDDGVVSNNNVSFLTAYGNGTGIYIAGGYLQTGQSCRSNLIAKCISTGNRVHQFYARWGGENDGTNGNGNVYGQNCFGVSMPDFVAWGSGDGVSAYSTLERLYGGPMNNVETDPLFTDPQSGDFRFQPGSPAANFGFGDH
jgi:hypothetical protein